VQFQCRIKKNILTGTGEAFDKMNEEAKKTHTNLLRKKWQL
jgi:hypothetical protein